MLIIKLIKAVLFVWIFISFFILFVFHIHIILFVIELSLHIVMNPKPVQFFMIPACPPWVSALDDVKRRDVTPQRKKEII